MSHPFTHKRPSPAFVVAMIALVVSLAGTAVALPGANTVRSDDIVNGQVKRQDVALNAVNTTRLSNGAVRSSDLGGNSVNSNKIVNGTVKSADIGTLTGGLDLQGSGPDSGLTFSNGTTSYGLYNSSTNFMQLDNELVMTDAAGDPTGLFLDGGGSIAINALAGGGGTLRINGESPNAASTIVLDNQALIFVQDAGGNKEALCVKFNSGAVQCFATEP